MMRVSPWAFPLRSISSLHPKSYSSLPEGIYPGMEVVESFPYIGRYVRVTGNEETVCEGYWKSHRFKTWKGVSV